MRQQRSPAMQFATAGLWTVIGALEDAEDYKAFEAAIIADYDAQWPVERELICVASRLSDLAGMKRSSGARPARFCLPSMHWIVANHKIEGAVSGSVADKTCRPIDATIIELPDPPIYAIDAELGRDGRAALSRKISELLCGRENLILCV